MFIDRCHLSDYQTFRFGEES